MTSSMTRHAAGPDPGRATLGARLRHLVGDPALRGSVALMASAVGAGGLGYVFWSVIARQTDAAAVGAVSAAVSSITFLASVGSLNLMSVFARYLPEAGSRARRLILTSYAAAAATGLVGAIVFLLTPWASDLVFGGDAGRVVFAVLVVVNSIFMIQDGGLVGLGRTAWVPVENLLVAVGRLALLPVAALVAAGPMGLLWAWGLPMLLAVTIVNVLLVGRVAAQHATRPPALPTTAELGRFVAVDSVTTAISAAVSAFLPALVTQRLGATSGGYFYVPWVIATMVSLLLSSNLIAMVKEAVAAPERADATIRRSLGMATVIVAGAAFVCLALPELLLFALGPDFAEHGAALLRWVGLSLPAVAVNLLFWGTCLVRRKAWPVLVMNLVISGTTVAGVLLLPRDARIGSVGMIHCAVQWVVTLGVLYPTARALNTIRGRRDSR